MLLVKSFAEKPGVRHLQAMLLCCSFILNFMQQGNLDVAVVAMTLYTTNDAKFVERRYPWGEDKVQLIYIFFFASMIFGNLLSGYLTTKSDLKSLLLIPSAAGVLSSYFAPPCVKHYGWKALLLARAVQGFSQGFVKPVAYEIIQGWFPTQELQILGPLMLAGIYLGAGLMMLMAGYLATGRVGWRAIFYFSGNFGALWCVTYAAFGASSPATCLYVSKAEKNYIYESVPEATKAARRGRRIPWKLILTNVPLYAATLSQAVTNIVFQMLIKLGPIYYQMKYGYSFKRTCVLGGLPWIIVFATVYIFTVIFKKLQRRSELDICKMRFYCNAFGQLGPYVMYYFLTLAKEWHFDIGSQLFGAVLHSFTLFGFYMNFFDLAPAYTGVVVGLSSSVSNLVSLLSLFVLNLTSFSYANENDERWQEDPNFTGWRRIYDVISACYLLGGSIFMFYASTKEQDFNRAQEGFSF